MTGTDPTATASDPTIHAAIEAPLHGRRLHPISPIVDVLAWLPRLWPLVLLGVSRSWGPWLLGSVVTAFAVRGALRWSTTTYGFDGRELVVASGLWNRTVRRAPVDRVQQVDVVRKLRHQAFGVAVVQVKLADAGPVGGDITLEVVSMGEAETMKARLEQARRRATLGEAMASAPPPPEHEVVRISDAVLALGGVTGASLMFVPAGVAALASLLDDVRLGDDAERVAADLPLAAAITGFVALSFVTAAIVSVLRSHGYRMTRRATDLVIERGMLERRATVVPIDRVQAVTLSRNLVRRRMGLASVHIATAGRLTGEGRGSANDSVPVVGITDALAVIGIAMGDRIVPPADRAMSAAATRRLVLRGAVVAVFVVSWTPFAFGAAWLLVFAPAAALGAWEGRLASRSRRHGIGTDAVTIDRGVFAWRSTIVPLDRVQSWSSTQSPFQRRHELHHVSVHVNGVRTVVVRDITSDHRAALLGALATTATCSDRRSGSVSPRS